MLEVRDLWKEFDTPDGAVSVLSGVSLAVEAGRSLALLGESGSGKSTLLHLIAGLERPDRGEIEIDGRRVEALSDSAAAALRREAIGLVFQQFNLIPSLTVDQNIALQARLAGRFDADWAARLAEGLGIAPFARRYPEELSGGQQQRVAIARALAPRPKLILADEPTGNLDEATGDQALALTLDLVAESGAVLIMATHSARLAERLEAQATLRGGRLL